MTKPKGQHIRVTSSEFEKQQAMDAIRERRANMLEQFRAGYTRNSPTKSNQGDSDIHVDEMESNNE